jgi:hypothetical protein
MADYCMQCTEHHLGMDKHKNDFVGVQIEADTKKELYSVVLCEGCGPCQVDHTGKCVSKDCLEKHGLWEVCEFDPCLLSGDPNPKGPCKFHVTINGKKDCGYG